MTSGGTHAHQNLTSGRLHEGALMLGGGGAVFDFQEEGQLGQ